MPGKNEEKRIQVEAVAILNRMLGDVRIVKANGAEVTVLQRSEMNDGAVVSCSITCGRYGTAECPRTRDVTGGIYAGDGVADMKMPVQRVGMLNRIPLYQLGRKNLAVLEGLAECTGSAFVSVRGLPDMKTLRKQRTVKPLPDRAAYQKRMLEQGWPEMRLDGLVGEMPYVVVSYMTALLMRKADDELDHVLVPISPLFRNGRLEGYRGLMQAEDLLEGVKC